MKKTYRSILSIGLLSVLVVSLVFMLTGCGLFNNPTAKIDTDATVTNGTAQVTAGEVVRFDGSDSEPSTSDGTITDYDWTFPNAFNLGSPADQEVQTGSFDTTGNYTVELKVTDDEGKSDKDSLDVEVS
ncbi:MAG: PKD domain-containing protein [Candidatus Bipolaricaulia bacterium]